MKINETDLEIIKSLVHDSRSKILEIAEKTNLSSSAINYRIKKLKKNNVLIDSVLALNMEKFGFQISALVCIKLKTFCESIIINLVKKQTVMVGIDKTIGKYDLCIYVFVKDIFELDNLKQELVKTEKIQDMDVLIFTKVLLTHGNLKL